MGIARRKLKGKPDPQRRYYYAAKQTTIKLLKEKLAKAQLEIKQRDSQVEKLTQANYNLKLSHEMILGAQRMRLTERNVVHKRQVGDLRLKCQLLETENARYRHQYLEQPMKVLDEAEATTCMDPISPELQLPEAILNDESQLSTGNSSEEPEVKDQVIANLKTQLEKKILQNGVLQALVSTCKHEMIRYKKQAKDLERFESRSAYLEAETEKQKNKIVRINIDYSDLWVVYESTRKKTEQVEAESVDLSKRVKFLSNEIESLQWVKERIDGKNSALTEFIKLNYDRPRKCQEQPSNSSPSLLDESESETPELSPTTENRSKGRDGGGFGYRTFKRKIKKLFPKCFKRNKVGCLPLPESYLETVTVEEEHCSGPEALEQAA